MAKKNAALSEAAPIPGDPVEDRLVALEQGQAQLWKAIGKTPPDPDPIPEPDTFANPGWPAAALFQTVHGGTAMQRANPVQALERLRHGLGVDGLGHVFNSSDAPGASQPPDAFLYFDRAWAEIEEMKKITPEDIAAASSGATPTTYHEKIAAKYAKVRDARRAIAGLMSGEFSIGPEQVRTLQAAPWPTDDAIANEGFETWLERTVDLLNEQHSGGPGQGS